MSTHEAHCFICQKHKEEIKVPGGAIYEDELVYVGHVHWGEEETYLGYVMIDIKRHIPGLAELTEEEAKAFGLVTSRVSRALKEREDAEHIYAIVSGNGGEPYAYASHSSLPKYTARILVSGKDSKLERCPSWTSRTNTKTM